MATDILVVLMALAIAVPSLSAQRMPDQAKEEVKTAMEVCQKRLNPPTDYLKSFKEGDMVLNDDNESTNCFFQCVLEEMQLVKDGEFMADNAKRKMETVFGNIKKLDGTNFDVAGMRKSIEECIMATKGNTQCQKNFRIWQCIQQRGAEAST